MADVIFRKDNRRNEVYALFPHMVWNHFGNVTYYGMLEGHSGADYDHCLKTSTLATEVEYKALKAHLETVVGYKLKVVKRKTYKKWLASYNEVTNQTEKDGDQ